MSDSLKFIIARVIQNVYETLEETKGDNSDFAEGENFAGYMVLDIIKSELYTHDFDLKEFGLDVNLEKLFLSRKTN